MTQPPETHRPGEPAPKDLHPIPLRPSRTAEGEKAVGKPPPRPNSYLTLDPAPPEGR